MSGEFDRLTGASTPFDEEVVGDLNESPQLSDASDDRYTPRQIKDAVQELLKYGLLEENRKPNLYRTALTQREAINQVLEPLDLALRVDDVRGLAFLVVLEQKNKSADEEWAHPLIRRQRLNIEQSLLVAILRQQFIAHEQEAGVGAGDASVALEDLSSQLQIYLGDLGSDALEHKRLCNLLEQLKGHGIVSDIDAHEQVIIRPIITHVANPENLQNLLHVFRAGARRDGKQEQLFREDEH